MAQSDGVDLLSGQLPAIATADNLPDDDDSALNTLKKHPSIVPEDRVIDFSAIGNKAEVE